jgi:metal-sulfur cluster biosynthetic enzyme
MEWQRRTPRSCYRHGSRTLITSMQSQSTPLADPDILRQALTQVIDPEVGMNIVDLGLIYDIRIAADRIEVDITMTTPACPMSSMIAEQAREVILATLPAETEVMVNLVWDPPWDASMMSDHAREHFGWR